MLLTLEDIYVLGKISFDLSQTPFELKKFNALKVTSIIASSLIPLCKVYIGKLIDIVNENYLVVRKLEDNDVVIFLIGNKYLRLNNKDI